MRRDGGEHTTSPHGTRTRSDRDGPFPTRLYGRRERVTAVTIGGRVRHVGGIPDSASVASTSYSQCLDTGEEEVGRGAGTPSIEDGWTSRYGSLIWHTTHYQVSC